MDKRWRPDGMAERLVGQVFERLQRDADPQIAHLSFENKLRRASLAAAAPRPLLRPGFRLLALLAGIFVLGSWAAGMPVPGWEDGQQITVALPEDFTPGQYPHWVGLMAKHGERLAARGGDSLLVDYKELREGGYALQLSLLGVGYTEANLWIREVMRDVPALSAQPYAITQPVMSHSFTLADMIAVKLGSVDKLQRSVARAWDTSTAAPSSNGRLYLLAQPAEYAHRVSMLTD